VRSLLGRLTPAEVSDLREAILRGARPGVSAHREPAVVVPAVASHTPTPGEFDRWLERNLKYLNDPRAA
jgi:hypothetical protein